MYLAGRQPSVCNFKRNVNVKTSVATSLIGQSPVSNTAFFSLAAVNTPNQQQCQEKLIWYERGMCHANKSQACCYWGIKLRTTFSIHSKSYHFGSRPKMGELSVTGLSLEKTLSWYQWQSSIQYILLLKRKWPLYVGPVRPICHQESNRQIFIHQRHRCVQK